MFSINDKIFAKIKGHQPWPAFVTKADKDKYNVTFFGTGQTGTCKRMDMFDFSMYVEDVLPTKRVTSKLRQAIDEANSFKITAEEFIFDPETHNEPEHETSLLELNEINYQLMFEKSKMEKSLRLAEEESEELCSKYRKEIDDLETRISQLNNQIKIKDNLITGLEGNIKQMQTDKETKPTTSTGTQTKSNTMSKSMITTELLGTNWLTDITIQPYLDMLNNKLLTKTSCIIINPLIAHAGPISRSIGN